MIELVQSTRQNLLSRAARALWHVLAYVVGAGLLSHLGLRGGVLSWQGLTIVLVPPTLVILWLLVFNTGRVSVPEHVLRLDTVGIQYVQPGESERLDWADYSGYTVRGWPLARVALQRRTGGSVTFDYLTFSRDQREILFRYLSTAGGAS